MRKLVIVAMCLLLLTQTGCMTFREFMEGMTGTMLEMYGARPYPSSGNSIVDASLAGAAMGLAASEDINSWGKDDGCRLIAESRVVTGVRCEEEGHD